MKEVKDKYLELSDEDLMNLYQKGDFNAFQTIYTRHSGRVLAYLKKKVSLDTAQDLLQESFEKLHRSRDKYSSQYPFLPWIFTISRNTLMDYYKKSESKLINATNFSGDLIDNLVAPTLESSSFPDLTNALSSLPLAQKRAIELRYMNDWSFSQIAVELDTTEANIRKLISRGIKKVKLSLNKKGDFNE